MCVAGGGLAAAAASPLSIHTRAQGGPTDLGNLILLCSYHHRFVHEGEWRIRGNPEAEVELVRPDGTVYGQGPPPLDPDVGKWLAGTAA